MKILVTGANGQLGHDFVERIGADNCIAVTRDDFDLTCREKVISCLTRRDPDVVIHCAAYTAVDKAQSDEERCFDVNAKSAGHVAQGCKYIGAKMVYISTDYVFDGKKSVPYVETDEAIPLNVYGNSKLAGEKEVMKICDKSFVVRTSWLYGNHGRNFAKTMLDMAEQGHDAVKVVEDQFGTPTYTKDLVEAVMALIDTEYYGLYHASNEGSCSWSEFAEEIFRVNDLNVEVFAVTTRYFNGNATRRQKAPRPKYSVMDNLGLREKLGFVMPDWRDGLRRFSGK